MSNKDSFFKSFPLLTGTGILFAILLCMLTSAMVYISIPSTAPFIGLFLGNGSNSSRGMMTPEPNSSATPFQPVAEIPQENLPTEIPLKNIVPTPTLEPEQSSNKEIKIEDEIGEIPPYASISGIYGSPQLYTLDCEAQAAVDWARFFGVNIDELEFIERMPKSDDPEEGFVGYINGPMGQLPPNDYGVHAGPVAALLREYDLGAKAVRGWDLEQIKNEIANGRPVIVWIVNLPFEIETKSYTASNGTTSTVARFEHTWIVTGYNMNVLTVIDSEWTYNVQTQTFMKRWNALGNQAIVFRE